jgi:hypothetical protein
MTEHQTEKKLQGRNNQRRVFSIADYWTSLKGA